MTFLEKLQLLIQNNNSLLCVGLDSDIEKLPVHLKDDEDGLYIFNKQLIDSTFELVCSYKIQIAFYSSHGKNGIESLVKTINYIKNTYPHIPVILDSKRGDIGSTALQYAKESFDTYLSDAVTVNPYLGHDSLEPFLNYSDKGVIILCRTSNPGAKDFQDLIVDSQPLFIHVAQKVNEWHEKYKNCLLVVGATYPNEMGLVREAAKNMFFLVPGIGAQGGNLKEVMHYGLRGDRSGLIIHAARSIIYASSGLDFAEKARVEALKLRDEINTYR